MFIIVDKTNLIVCITSAIKYVKQQENGTIVLAQGETPTAVYAADNDTFYPLVLSSKLGTNVYSVVEPESIPDEVVPNYWYYTDEFFTTTEKQAELERIKASNDALAMLVDQEYRLMLLELGVE